MDLGQAQLEYAGLPMPDLLEVETEHQLNDPVLERIRQLEAMLEVYDSEPAPVWYEHA